jgi:hypothetical protein
LGHAGLKSPHEHTLGAVTGAHNERASGRHIARFAVKRSSWQIAEAHEKRVGRIGGARSDERNKQENSA